MYVCSSEQFLHTGSNEMFVASIVNIKTIDKDMLDSEWALTSCALRLVCTSADLLETDFNTTHVS